MTARLRTGIRRDLADLRVRLEEATLRGELHLRTGNPDGARSALQDQERLLDELGQAVRHRIADALIERDAETVLRTAADELEASGVCVGDFGRSPLGGGDSAPRRAFVSAVAAVAAALVAVFAVPSGNFGGQPSSSPATPEAAASPDAAPTASSRAQDLRRAATDPASSASSPSEIDRRQRAAGELAASAPAPSFVEGLLARFFQAVAASPAAELTDTVLEVAGLAEADRDGNTAGEGDEAGREGTRSRWYETDRDSSTTSEDAPEDDATSADGGEGAASEDSGALDAPDTTDSSDETPDEPADEGSEDDYDDALSSPLLPE